MLSGCACDSGRRSVLIYCKSYAFLSSSSTGCKSKFCAISAWSTSDACWSSRTLGSRSTESFTSYALKESGSAYEGLVSSSGSYCSALFSIAAISAQSASDRGSRLINNC